ncbi:MAG: DNA cytosine methyltransferase [Bacteroidales bacterium]|jgi:DNA (cytosine-5)-methyltransferase 1|nr:DNA cytosine methyltransferase [Bacteroidales bacterium]
MPTSKEKQSYSVVSYFCGCGGLDLGFRGDFRYKNTNYARLPFDIKAAYDNEVRCIETYNGYFGSECAFVKDLSSIDIKSVPKAQVLIGGFPCQEFSSCGPLGGIETERGRLYETLISYMDEHQPTVVVGENVINLERMNGGTVLETIKTDLANVGYKIEVWKLFAPDYGIPQRRARLFFICIRDDIYSQYGFPSKPIARFIGKHRSIEWAIGDLINIIDDSIPNQDQYFGASRAKRGNGQGDESNKKDLPAYTIRANPKSRVQFHYSLERRLTVRECARIQTFPDDFVFTHAKTASISQIGNAVPPVLAYSVAKTVATYLNKAKEIISK